MRKIRSFFMFLLIALFLLMPLTVSAEADKKCELSSNQIDNIENWIEKNMKDGKIPGLSVVVVKGNSTVYEKGFGYADIKNKISVTPDTLFELGSNSKAFTALGILKLESDGLIKLDDPVTKYIPWLKLEYKGKYKGRKINEYVPITIEQFMHQTSGIPFNSIGDIPIGDEPDTLERTIKGLVDSKTKLDFYPGEKFLYATINYDVLGLVIEKITGQPYEKYIKENIIYPLELDNTFLSRRDAYQKHMAVGYKLSFLRHNAYDAPMYRGNLPAGYFISNAIDMEKWLKIQLSEFRPDKSIMKVIEKSHLPDRSVAPAIDGSSYAGGWAVYQSGGGEVSHGGNNPNFSSYITFRPQQKLGVAVLANLNSAYTRTIAEGIMNTLVENDLPKPLVDMYKSLDNFSFTITCIAIPFILLTLVFFLLFIIQIFKRERRLITNLYKSLGGFAFLIAFLAALAYCLYKLPNVLYYGLPWSFIKVWAPGSLITAVILILISTSLFGIYYYFNSMFSKTDRKDLFTLIVLSVVSGFGNAIIIFIVNEAFNRESNLRNDLLLYFIMGIASYVLGQKLVRTKLICLTNKLVYQKRIELINSILHTSYQKFEEIEDGKVHAGLNNDTETISNFANIVITGVTSMVTMICCFVYLGVINFYGLLISILIIFIAAGLYFVVGRSARRLWEYTRDIQNTFFKFINDLIGGYKELNIHYIKRKDFQKSMQESCNVYMQRRIEGDVKFANAFVVGELLFVFVIGAVTFAFPIIFKDIQDNSLRNYIFVFLYMTAPVHGILNLIPNVIQFKISWNRIKGLLGQIEVFDEAHVGSDVSHDINEDIEVKLEGVEFHYKKSDEEIFTIGPIDYCFKSREIVFITGGNGSGKSTLAKLITGLYKPDDGAIYVNKKRIDPVELSQYYSTVFSDYYLFEKLYGIDYKEKQDEINKYLKILHIEDKIEINNGEFSTIKLSSGQRKRLALLVAYLEDRPIYLFDEWAADQDPEFKRFFYRELLPKLKESGKCIIAITHDDRYFDAADRIIKMDMGMIAQEDNKLIAPVGNK